VASRYAESSVKYEVKLLKTDEGYAVWCPALPGCWSQGQTESEAIENIKDAIAEYLADGDDSGLVGAETRTVEVG
jgi:predicted RNase H-like HicB family nuclease